VTPHVRIRVDVFIFFGMSRGEVNNREVIRLPRAAIGGGGGGATTMAGAERDIAGGRRGVEGFSSWRQAAAAA